MGRFQGLLLLSLALILILNLVFVCNGGTSSIFVRKIEKSVDMPLDSDVFHVPSGYNAPQQVFFVTSFSKLIHGIGICVFNFTAIFDVTKNCS
jgi:hypothetical protein